MFLLALETSGPRCSAALIGGDGDVRVLRSQGGRNHLQHLMPLVQQLMYESGLQLGDMSAIAVSYGPGSFTGIRIGVSSARALAQVLGCPLVPVDSLKAFAYRAPEAGLVYCPIFDARRSQVYGGAYLWETAAEPAVNSGAADSAAAESDNFSPETLRELVPGGAYSIEEYLDLLDRSLAALGGGGIRQAGALRLRFFGDGLGPCGDLVSRWARDRQEAVEFAEGEGRSQDALGVARLGLALWQSGAAKPFEEVLPNYLRKAEAQRRLEEGAIDPGAKALVARAETPQGGRL